MRRLAMLLLALFLVAGPALGALSPDEELADPALEARARALSKELRCLVCQNQSIDDSDADLARDLRLIVRERLLAGEDESQIKAYLTERYGDFVLLTPPVRPATWALWFGPLLLLAGGGALCVVFLRRRRTGLVEPEPLGPDEQARLRALLAERGKETSP
ncbi:cytochrome c-type biogenesis protein [Marinimicrococcus flavescens]|uniref:Cytochrome c-type biogenesis protein n=1 Tax=Marinimicrococcus flavescens TaxID=3031815 RepID=A0AAP3V227_9PROT|nr:cytochrome c-type biogenesis protein CcmH [Marinimicrococcus flavescens]